MKSQPKVSIKGVVNHHAFSIFLLFVLSLFMVGNVQAKKPQPAPGPSGPDNNAIWSGDHVNTDILSELPRSCALSQAASDESSGKYSCALNKEIILYDFEWMKSTPIHTRGEDWLCNSKKMFFHLVPDAEFSYSWNGNCKTGCGVTIVNDFSYINYYGEMLDHITIEGIGTATTNTANPFTNSQSLKVDKLHVTFFAAKGNNKVAAVCELTPRTNYPVTFVTTAVPIIADTPSKLQDVRPSRKD